MNTSDQQRAAPSPGQQNQQVSHQRQSSSMGGSELQQALLQSMAPATAHHPSALFGGAAHRPGSSGVTSVAVNAAANAGSNAGNNLSANLNRAVS